MSKLASWPASPRARSSRFSSARVTRPRRRPRSRCRARALRERASNEVRLFAARSRGKWHVELDPARQLDVFLGNQERWEVGRGEIEGLTGFGWYGFGEALVLEGWRTEAHDPRFPRDDRRSLWRDASPSAQELRCFLP